MLTRTGTSKPGIEISLTNLCFSRPVLTPCTLPTSYRTNRLWALSESGLFLDNRELLSWSAPKCSSETSPRRDFNRCGRAFAFYTHVCHLGLTARETSGKSLDARQCRAATS